jgi:hypothetical protein
MNDDGKYIYSLSFIEGEGDKISCPLVPLSPHGKNGS